MKYIFSILFSLATVIVCLYSFNSNAVSASAATMPWCSVERLTASDSAYTQAGDFKVTVHLEDNEGFKKLWADLSYYQTQFEMVSTASGEPFFTAGGLSISSDSDIYVQNDVDLMHSLVEVRNTGNVTGDGALFSVYFRRISGTSVLPVTGINVDRLGVNGVYHYDATSEYCQMVNIFRIGDATLDGRIAIGDAQFILRIIANANGTAVTASNFMSYVPANFAVGDCVLSFEAMDVDEDGVLTSDDATAIQNYVAGYAATGALLEYCTVYLDANAYTS